MPPRTKLPIRFNMGAIFVLATSMSSLSSCTFNPWDPLGTNEDVARHQKEPMQNRQWMDVTRDPWMGSPRDNGADDE
jgi:hypothetical protein